MRVSGSSQNGMQLSAARSLRQLPFFVLTTQPTQDRSAVSSRLVGVVEVFGRECWECQKDAGPGHRSLSDACMAIGLQGMQYQSTTVVAGTKP